MKMKNMARITFVMIIFIAGAVLAYSADPILEANLKIMHDGNATGEVMITFGNPSTYINQSGEYSMSILNAAGAVVWKRSYGLNFVILTNPGRASDYELVNEKISYKPEMYELRFSKGGNILYRRYLDFCDANGICDANENSLGCKADCPPELSDGICIRENDGICDLDCISGTDPDCKALESEKAKAKAALIMSVIAVFLLIITGFHERKKISGMLEKYVLYPFMHKPYLPWPLGKLRRWMRQR